MRKPRPELLFLVCWPLLLAAKPGEPPQVGKPEELPLSEALKLKAARLDAREAEIEQSRADLKSAEEVIDQKILALKALVDRQEAIKAEIVAERQSLTNANASMADERLRTLGKVTEKMPPAKAANYLASMEEPAAAALLKTISIDKAAKIMASLAPSKAAAISRLYLKHDLATRESSATRGN